jgi:hypothetical protein
MSVSEFDALHGFTETFTWVFNGHKFTQRTSDGYMNASEMCKIIPGANVRNWRRKKVTKRFTAAVCKRYSLPASDLIQSRVGVGLSRFEKNTWIHPKLVIQFGIWLDIKFGVHVQPLAFRFFPDVPNVVQTVHDQMQWLARQLTFENLEIKVGFTQRADRFMQTFPQATPVTNTNMRVPEADEGQTIPGDGECSYNHTMAFLNARVELSRFRDRCESSERQLTPIAVEISQRCL